MTIERFCPNCPDCDTKMKFISEILTECEHNDNDYYDVRCRIEDLFQCSKCKTIKVGSL